MGIAEWRDQLRSGEVSARELTDQHLKRIGAVEPSVHAFLEVTAERARADAPYDLVDVFALGHNMAAHLQHEHVDPQSTQPLLVQRANGDLLDSEYLEWAWCHGLHR